MNSVAEALRDGQTLSFEFFPPKTDEAQRALHSIIGELMVAEPSFVSVTCGAGGQGHDRTRDIVVEIAAERPIPAVAHLTCVGHTRAQIEALLDDYVGNGVTDVLALAGDWPADGSTPTGDFRFASELVELIRARGDLSIGVAAHPEVHPRSASRSDDRRHLADKLAAADYAITQFFFDPTLYFELVEELAALGVEKPIIPGVFPVTKPAVVKRFADLNGTHTPAELWARLEAASDADRETIAIDAAVELAQALLDGGAPGVHLYTMNRSATALAIAERLGSARGHSPR
ncbi:MAG: methylenetetrahydrofolate reductase [Acidimicrobiia bacterium]|nr:methylenetetrahydrofolate reductase [Acidimicrobiia bacterium]